MDHVGCTSQKGKVIFVLGATATGKSKLAIDLAIHFNGEVINADKMQVYGGLDIITNKVTDEEMLGVPHHLIGVVHPDADYTAFEFQEEVMPIVETIIKQGHLPIIAGGSNSYVETLVDGEDAKFRKRYDCFFIWVDVELPILHEYVGKRVDKMVEQGLVEEARSMFMSKADYTRGIRRSIGLPEMDSYLRAETDGISDDVAKQLLLEEAINKIKLNTCKLTLNQLAKIHRFCKLPGWTVQRVDATMALEKKGLPEEHEAWLRAVVEPSIEKVSQFLSEHQEESSHQSVNPAIEEVKENMGCQKVAGSDAGVGKGVIGSGT